MSAHCMLLGIAILVVLWVAAYSWTTEETFEQQF